jgi:RNase H-like domain found in reverse transcriptase/Reverse transcriptase (RNA-dependent DNA polymerase)
MREGDEWLTAFTTHRGLYEALVMMFRLRNAPGTFQRIVDMLVAKLPPHVRIRVRGYFDDILLATFPGKDHWAFVREILKVLQENGFYVKLSKCIFKAEEVPFLGTIVGRNGMRMDNKKVQAIIDWPVPKTLQELQMFLGFCGFYRKFIERFAFIVGPLNKLLRSGVPFKMLTARLAAFNLLKQRFTEAPMLRVADESLPYTIETDASKFAYGAVLLQPYNGRQHPIAYLSKAFTEPERNYPTHDRELLGIIRALDEWRHYLEGARTKSQSKRTPWPSPISNPIKSYLSDNPDGLYS